MPARTKRPKTGEITTGQWETLEVMGALTVVKSDPSVVSLFVAERTFPAGHCSPIQENDTDNELIYMLEGEIIVIEGGKEQPARRGECVALPRGCAHSYRNDSGNEAKGLIISHPGIQAIELLRNLDRADRAARRAGRALTNSEVAQLADQYGVQLQWQ